MIGYVVLGTNDLVRATAFYDTLLAEMGVTRMMEFGDRGYAWGAAMDKPMLCIMKPYDGQPATVGNGVMIAVQIAAERLATAIPMICILQHLPDHGESRVVRRCARPDLRQVRAFHPGALC